MTGQIHDSRRIAEENSSVHRRIAVLISLTLSLAIQAGLAWELRVSIANGFTDFQEFYGAAMVVRGGQAQQLYDPSVQSHIQQSFTRRTLEGVSSSHYYNHAPYEVLLYLPLTRLSFVHAAWCWWGINLILLYGGMYMLLPFLPSAAGRLQWALLCMPLFVPLLIAEIQGQDTILTLFLFVLCFVSLARDRFATAGAALAITMYKPPLALPMLLLVALTSRKRWSVLGGFFGTCLILFLLSGFAVGWTCTVTYPQTLAGFASSEGGHWHLNDLPNLRGLANTILAAHFSQSAIFIIVAALSALVVALTAWLVGTADWDDSTRPLHFSLIVLATLIVGYQEYAYDMTILLLPLVLLWEWADVEAARGQLLTRAGFGLFCISALTLLHSQIFACALIFVFVLACRAAYGEFRQPRANDLTMCVH